MNMQIYFTSNYFFERPIEFFQPPVLNNVVPPSYVYTNVLCAINLLSIHKTKQTIFLSNSHVYILEINLKINRKNNKI